MTGNINDIFGKKLQKARLGKGISIQEAADATRMRPEKIVALEASDLSKFPSATYAKSFLVLYARFLGVDVKGVADTIDTGSHITFDDYAYLRNSDLSKMDVSTRPDAPTPTGYSAPSVRMQEKTSLMPLVIISVLIVAGLFAFMMYSNINRLNESAAPTPPPVPTNSAVTPVTPPQPPVSVVLPKPTVTTQPPTPKPALPVVGSTTPLPKPAPVVPAPEPPAPIAPPTSEPEVRAAIPLRSASRLTINDAAALMELGEVTTPTVNSQPADTMPEEESNAVEDMLVVEPKRKVAIIVRKDGPEGKIEFSDTLHPRARGLRLPPGKWYIQSEDPEAIEISKSGRAIPYTGPGILVE